MGAPLITRRDLFLRLRSSAQGRTLDLSCRTLFMRCQDGDDRAPADESDDDGRGEPPAVWTRRTPADVLALVEHELRDIQVLRLFEPEWLEHMAGGAQFESILNAFRSRGGRVEPRVGQRSTEES